MSKRTMFIALVVLMMVVLIGAVPVMAKAVTFTETYHDTTMVIPDLSICEEIPVWVTLTYNGVMHVTEYTGNHPNSGTSHAMFKMNFEALVHDQKSGELIETAHGVKTIFHDNVNRQNDVSNFNFVSIGTSGNLLINGHINWRANGNPVEINHVVMRCQ